MRISGIRKQVNLAQKAIERARDKRPQFANVVRVDAPAKRIDIQVHRSNAILRNIRVIGDMSGVEVGSTVQISWWEYGRPVAIANLDLTDLEARVDALDGGTPPILEPSTYATTSQIREKLTANRTYYVRTDGLDSNVGLVNSSSGAFLTIQKAVNAVASIDANGYQITIQVANGTYNEKVVLNNVLGIANPGDLIIQGDTTTPANVVVNATSGTCFLARGLTTPWLIKGVKITGSNGYGIASENGSYIEFSDIDCGTFTGSGVRHLRAADGGTLYCVGNYRITGGATHHYVSLWGAVRIFGVTVTLVGTPGFTAYANVMGGGIAYNHGCTFVGSASGSQYSVTLNGILWLAGVTLPGNSGGTTATGGQVNL